MLATIDRLLARPFGLASGLIIMAMSLLVSAEVAMRALGRSLPGVPEIAENMIVFFVFLSLAYTQSERANVSMDFLVQKLPFKAQRWASIASKVVCLMMTILLVVGTSREAIKSWTLGEFKISSFDVPLWPSKFAVTLGLLMLAVVFANQILREMRGKDLRSASTGVDA